LWHQPSAAVGGQLQVQQSKPLGVRIVLNGKPEMAAVGTALHHCIARAGVVGTVDPDEVQRILSAWGVNNTMDQAAVVAQVEALFTWLGANWPGCKIHVEVPIEAAGPDKTRIRGRIDLLVETPDGWILFDHKANPSDTAKNDDLAEEHGPQLSAYAHALKRATGKPVLQHWLFMPVAARVVQLA
jgi:ATP-dependent exoDNAse (exonuclease V) beta subunit